MSADAPNIITYIGVPLAVLGVLPILYNVMIGTATYFAAKHKLSKSRRNVTKTDLKIDYFGGEVAVELCSVRIIPLQREKPQYWTVSSHEVLPGGSWELFNWDSRITGKKTQRLRSSKQLRQLQAEIGFEELILFLLDLGTVPNPTGWRSLQLSGIWTPIDTCLMVTSADGKPVLTIAPFDALTVDGRLSLTVRYQPNLVSRGKLLHASNWIKFAAGHLRSSRHGDDAGVEPRGADLEKESPKTTGDMELSCTATSMGKVLIEPQDIDVRHLCTHRGNSSAVWFCSALTAFAASRGTPMSYRIPEDILNFAHSYSVPSGILVLLKVVDATEVPNWKQSQPNPLFSSRTWPSPAPSLAPLSKKDVDNMVQQQVDLRQQLKKGEADRITQALQSKAWDLGAVSQRCLRWLNARMGTPYTAEDLAALVLRSMIEDEDLAASLSAMLSLCRSWSETGGMGIAEFKGLQQDNRALEAFCRSTLLLALIRDYEDMLVAGMYICFDRWKDIRLG